MLKNTKIKKLKFRNLRKYCEKYRKIIGKYWKYTIGIYRTNIIGKYGNNISKKKLIQK